MSTIGTLIVELAMDGARFTAGTKRASDDARKFNRRMARMEAQLKKGAKAFDRFNARLSVTHVAAYAAALGAATKIAVNYANEIKDAAFALGVHTDFLQRQQYAAEQSGFAMQAQEKVLRRLSAGIGELGRANSTLATYLRDLDPELLKQLRGAENLEEAWGLLIARLAATESQFKQTAIAAAIGGQRQANDLAAFASQGGAALKEMGDRAQRLGIILENDLINEADKLHAVLNDLTFTLKAGTARAFILNSDAIDRLASGALQSLPGLFSGLIKSLQWLVDNGETLIRIFAAMKLSSAGIKAGAALGGVLGKSGAKIGAVAGGLLGAGVGSFAPELIGKAFSGGAGGSAVAEQPAVTQARSTLGGDYEKFNKLVQSTLKGLKPLAELPEKKLVEEIYLQRKHLGSQIQELLVQAGAHLLSDGDLKVFANTIEDARGLRKEIDLTLASRVAPLFEKQADSLFLSNRLAEQQLKLVTADAAARGDILARIDQINLAAQTGLGYNEQQLAHLSALHQSQTALAEAAERAASLKADVDTFNADSADVERLAQIQAALDSGQLSAAGLTQALTEQRDLLYEMGEAGFIDSMIVGFSQLSDGVKSFGQSLATIATSGVQGIVSGLGSAVAAGQKLDQVFATAIRNMIAGVIQLGLQWLLNQALVLSGVATETAAKISGIATVSAVETVAKVKATGENVAAAGVSAAAWTPAAVASSIGTFGAALALGAIAVGLIASFREGGIVSGPGTGTSDSIPAFLSNREFVMPAAQTAEYRAELEAMRLGRFDALAHIAGLRQGGLIGGTAGSAGPTVDDLDAGGDYQNFTIDNRVVLDGIELSRLQNESSIDLHGRGYIPRRLSAA